MLRSWAGKSKQDRNAETNFRRTLVGGQLNLFIPYKLLDVIEK